MGEEDMLLAVTLPRLPKTEKKNPNSVRFLGILKQPDSSADSDLDEIWASDDVDQDHHPLGPTADYPPGPDLEPEPVYSSGFGLSALLTAEDRTPAVRRTPVPVSARRFAGTESMARSAPMNVPTWRHARRAPLLDDVEDGYEKEDEDDEEMVPPHVIVARSHVTTFSVFEGVGRTLKGRDLRRVRNAVFQKTGFLD